MPLFGSKKGPASTPAPTLKGGAAAAGAESTKQAAQATAKVETSAKPEAEVKKKTEAKAKAKGEADAEARKQAEESRQKAQDAETARQKDEAAARQKESAAARQKEAAVQRELEKAAAQVDAAEKQRHAAAEKGWRAELTALTAKQNLESGLAERLVGKTARLQPCRGLQPCGLGAAPPTCERMQPDWFEPVTPCVQVRPHVSR